VSRIFLRCAGIIGVLLAVGGTAISAPITFITALPVAQDQLVVRSYQEGKFGSTDSENSYYLLFPQTFAYGPTGSLALFATVGLVDNYLVQPEATHRVTRNSSGFGDSLFFARYTLIHIDWPPDPVEPNGGATLRFTPLAGAYLPTGRYNIADAYGRLPLSMQTGSGSVDPYWGAAAGYQTADYELDWDATYRYNTAASSGFRLGNEARTDLSFQYRVWPWRLPAGVSDYLLLVMETNLIWDGISRIAGAPNLNTGGFTWFIDFGTYYATPQGTFGGVVQIPVVQSLNGVGQIPVHLRVQLYFERYFGLPSLLGG